MCKFIDHKFVNMCKQGIIGSFLGLIFGAILGLLIYWIQFPLLWLSDPSVTGDLHIYSKQLWATAAHPGALGAGVGATIGAIFGAIQGLKSTSKK
jgi:tetrahydromethanopterin S-methyltransferase subunit G